MNAYPKARLYNCGDLTGKPGWPGYPDGPVAPLDPLGPWKRCQKVFLWTQQELAIFYTKPAPPKCLHHLDSAYWPLASTQNLTPAYTTPETSLWLEQPSTSFWVILDKAQLYIINALRVYFVSNCAAVWGLDTVHQWTPFWRAWQEEPKVIESVIQQQN